MGPDCGTAIVNGVPLGFANKVKKGNIGIVAASGTGLQQVSCLIDRWGGGISQALVTTVLGLCVAIPSLLFFTLLSEKAKGISSFKNLKELNKKESPRLDIAIKMLKMMGIKVRRKKDNINIYGKQNLNLSGNFHKEMGIYYNWVNLQK